MLKDILGFYGINLPIDLTVLCGMAVIVTAVPRFLTKGVDFKYAVLPLASLGLLFFWVITNSFWSPSTSYLYTKIAQFALLVLAFVAPIVKGQWGWKRFYTLFYGASVLIALWYLSKYTAYIGTEVFYQFAGLGLSSGLVLGILIVQLTSDKPPFKDIPLSIRWVMIPILASIIFLMGARGPLLFAIIAAGSNYFFRLLRGDKVELKFKPKAIGLLSALTLVLILGFQIANTRTPASFNRIVNRSVHRLELLIGTESSVSSQSSSHGASVDKRVEQIQFSVDYILNEPLTFLLGYGFGSYSIYEHGEDGRGYPHNILLEILFELGLIGLILFIVFLASVVYSAFQNSNRIVVFSVIFYLMLNLLKSSSIVDSRYLFAFLALMLLPGFAKLNANDANDGVSEAGEEA